MTSNNDPQQLEEISDELGADQSLSIDDFIKELEEKEKDLHISSELVIEVEEAEFDDTNDVDIVGAPETDMSEDESDGGGDDEFSELAAEPELEDLPEVEPPPPVDTASYGSEVEALRAKIEKMEAERGEYLENSRRRQKDFENFRKRTEREREETYQNQLSNLASRMLPVLDNLDRALDSASNSEERDPAEFRQFFDGIVMVNQQLNEVLAEMGVEPIKSVNEQFDPNYHEAVATEETLEHPSHTIIEELLKGYKIGEKIIRPAMVTVATAPDEEAPGEETPTSD